MIGIYMMTNVIDGTNYIGQSKDIDKRIKQHFYHRNNPVSAIDFAIKLYGVDKFVVTILEECTEDKLDEREDYYIKLYGSHKNGYNIIRGGQDNIGESNSNANLTELDVYNIRESYNNHERKRDVFERYKNKVTWYSFSNIWDGYSWKNIHYDVYTNDNKKYYTSRATNGELSDNAAFTNQEVLELRKRYVNESAKEIYSSVEGRCKYATLQQILFGRSYKDVPIYDKKNKKWINN